MIETSMQIAVASGKGGTGKTTIATSLALSLIEQGQIRYLDCDVEAPNGHLFLTPVFSEKTDAVIRVPQILTDKCTVCGKCVDVCQFHALAKVGKNLLVFPQLCHGCGSCTWNCPENAIVEQANAIGVIEKGLTPEGIHFYRGLLTISEPMPTPIIRQLKKLAGVSEGCLDILDAPPGASCSVVETLRGTDFAILVTEPTPFGLHDLKQIVGILKDMNIPGGVVINRDGIGDEAIDSYCLNENLPILLRIPFDRRIAEGVAKGETLLDIHPEYRQVFFELFRRIRKEV